MRNYLKARRELTAITIGDYSRPKAKKKAFHKSGIAHPACFECPFKDCVAGSPKTCRHIKKVEERNKA